MIKTIITCEPHHYMLAIREARHLIEHPEEKQSFGAYGPDAHSVQFVSRRNNKSITIRQVKP